MDGLEADLAGQAAVLRIDIRSEVGRAAGQTYDVRAVPTLLVFAGDGELLLRQTGKPDADSIRAAVTDWYTSQ